MVTRHFTLTMTPKHLFLLLLCHTAWSMMVARCPKYWQDRGGTDQCYLIHSGGRARSFYDARTYCKAHGGDFAFIDTVSMREWLSLAVAEVGDIGQYAYMWVGAKYSSNAWQWVGTGKPINSTVVPFMGTGTGNCAAFTVDSRLIKQNCSQELKFICHRNITIPPPCDYDDGWEEMYQSCFKKSAQKKSWHDGQLECKIDNGNLITVWGITEQQLVTDFAFDVQDNVWIGFTEEGHAGNFRWISGGNSTYINWGDNQPDLSLHGYGAAVIDENDENGRWVVQKITNMFHYMCKKQQGACLPGWEQFQDSCYYFNTEATDKVVWEDAKSICEAVGASMVVLDTDEENKFIFNHIMDIDNLWIGLYSVPNDTVYWTDGSTMDSKNYTYMKNSDRDNALKAKDQQCVFFQKLGDPGKMTPSWVPTDCHDPRHYVCEVGVGDPINLLPPDNKRYCAEGWEQSNDHCYFFSTDEQTWSSAASVCSANDAKLASIVTWAEQDFIFDHQRSESWVGLNDRLNEGTYVWSDGSKLTITNWNNGEPSGTGENCVQIKADTGKWNDNSCDQKLTFSCKKKASITPIDVKTTTIPTQDPTACGWDWTENPETGECYRLELQELTFSDARSVCQELPYDSDQSSPDVVSLYSSEEQTYIYNQLLSQHLSQNMIWLGMKNDIDGNRWLDGTPVAYYNWEDGEPNGYYTEDCVNMYLEDGKWNDMNCEERMAFVCEKKGRNYVGPQPPPTPEGWFCVAPTQLQLVAILIHHPYHHSPTTPSNTHPLLVPILIHDGYQHSYQHSPTTSTNTHPPRLPTLIPTLTIGTSTRSPLVPILTHHCYEQLITTGTNTYHSY
ncbi:macrophage mannose receptor 1-like [Homarus americanus]|uniref:macrophage mannose receptor 1-like n=1 Tax=Homarus americanus TaxID=6706 RepID=UPI001C48264E|nr:macrophage mannose receptor 1-like [Homarus americanus]